MVGWATFQCFTIELDRFVDVPGSHPFLKFSDERFGSCKQLFNW